MASGKRNIQTCCLACGDTHPKAQHPLFEGGLCKEHCVALRESIYLVDEDGSSSYCSVCAWGDEVIVCDKDGCGKSYCMDCIEIFCSTEYADKIKDSDTFFCPLCTGEKVHLLNKLSLSYFHCVPFQ